MLTALNYGAAEALRPTTGLKGHLDYVDTLLSIGVFLEIALFFIAYRILRLGLRNRPLSEVWQEFTPRRLTLLVALAILVNINLTVLGQVKAQLDLLIPFRADPLLADWDNILFGGVDPWRALQWASHPYMTQAYHFVWLLWVGIALCFVGLQPASDRKANLLISYFALWTVGPGIHYFAPAAGPLFYDDLGLGDRFAAMPITSHTREVEKFLWDGFTTQTINFAGGISAMPSLHIATMVWAAVVFLRTRWFAVAVALAIYIFVASILTGWHYALDGIAGALMAIGVWMLVSRISGKRQSPADA